MAKPQEFRIGVIGAGGRGQLAQHAHKPDDGLRLVAGADTNPAALDDLKANIGDDIFTTQDYRELLAREDIHAVFITTPDFLHEQHAIDALTAGKHVYLEKPMAITIEGCDRILRTAYQNKLRLYLGHNMRHMTVIQKMKSLIDEGAIGQIKAAWCRHFIGYGGDAYFKDWHADRSKSTSLLLQKAAHDIDVMHWLAGGYTQRVVAQGALTLYDKITDRHPADHTPPVQFDARIWPPLSQTGMNPVLDVEDLSMMLMELDNGVFATYQQCHYTPDAWRNYTFIGTEGRIENFGDVPSRCVVRLWNRRTNYNPYGDEQYFIPATTGTHGGADPLIVDEFIDYVRTGVKTTTSPIAARNAVAAGCIATQSLRTNATPLDIPPVPKDLIEYFEKN